MSARVSFSFVLTFLVLLCQTLATKPGALGPCRKVAKKMGAVTSPGFANYVRVVGDKHGSDVQSRRLMQDVSCEWSAEEEECGVSDATAAKLFLESTSPVGQFIGQAATCGAQTNKRRCENVGYCFWARPECTFADYSLGNEDSPCVKHAPGLFAFLAANSQCGTHQSRAVCEAPTCEWNAEEGACEASIFEVFFASGDADVENIEDLIESLEGDGDRQFWRTVFECAEQAQSSCAGDCEWDPEDASCGPTARTIFDALVPDDYVSGDGVCDFMSFFAQSDCPSYSTPTECLDDDTCTFDEGGCSPDASVLVGVAILEDPELLVQVTAAGDSCGGLTTAEECA